jgi:hypothetical protein
MHACSKRSILAALYTLTSNTPTLTHNRYDGIVGDKTTRKLSTQVLPVTANQVLTLKLGI